MRLVILAIVVPRTGVPPVDLVEDVHKALRAAGWDPDLIFSLSTTIGGEWNYDPCRPYEHRFYQKRISERTVPMARKTLEESLSLAQFCFVSALFIATRFSLALFGTQETATSGL